MISRLADSFSEHRRRRLLFRGVGVVHIYVKLLLWVCIPGNWCAGQPTSMLEKPCYCFSLILVRKVYKRSVSYCLSVSEVSVIRSPFPDSVDPQPINRASWAPERVKVADVIHVIQ